MVIFDWSEEYDVLAEDQPRPVVRPHSISPPPLGAQALPRPAFGEVGQEKD